MNEFGEKKCDAQVNFNIYVIPYEGRNMGLSASGVGSKLDSLGNENFGRMERFRGRDVSQNVYLLDSGRLKKNLV